MAKRIKRRRHKQRSHRFSGVGVSQAARKEALKWAKEICLSSPKGPKAYAKCIKKIYLREVRSG